MLWNCFDCFVATGLKCYKCSSLLDEKCGDDWELEGTDGDKYLVQCHTQASACQKIVGEIQGNSFCLCVC